MATETARHDAIRPGRALKTGSNALLGAASLAAVTALVCHWGVNAEPLGAHDMGLAILLATVEAFLLVGSLYIAPVLLVLGLLLLLLRRERGSAVRILGAGAVFAAPLAILAWLE